MRDSLQGTIEALLPQGEKARHRHPLVTLEDARYSGLMKPAVSPEELHAMAWKLLETQAPGEFTPLLSFLTLHQEAFPRESILELQEALVAKNFPPYILINFTITLRDASPELTLRYILNSSSPQQLQEECVQMLAKVLPEVVTPEMIAQTKLRVVL